MREAQGSGGYAAEVLRLWGLERLEDAKKETWPWWVIDRHPDGWWIREYVRLPDFANDDAASVTLAEKMADLGILEIHSGHQRSYPSVPRYLVNWRPFDFNQECRRGRGATLGAALVSALEAREKTQALGTRL